MIGFIDQVVTKNCINHNAYGEICVLCGCCEREPDEKKRISNQLEYYKECLTDVENFSGWCDDDNLRRIQEKNIRSNIDYYKQQISELEKLKDKKG